MAERVRIASADLVAEIDPFGAELQSLRTAEGRELMWSGDPAFWAGRAPLLFPIVGRLNGDCYRLDDAEHAMPKHGFARRSPFDVISPAPDAATFQLRDDAETRAIYPFAFVFEMRFALAGPTLAMTATIANPGDAPLPASFGYHPAFAWPLPFGAPRDAHRIVFEHDEPAALRAITPGGLIAGCRETPVAGRTIALADALFTDDALVWDKLASRSLTYGAPGHPSLDIAVPDTPWLGIWTKPGAGFVCIEPWAGMADPEGYAGDLRDKPGVMLISPGASRSFRMDVTLRT